MKLRPIKERPKKVIYIAGPITDVPNYWEPFEKAEDELTAAGHIVLTPTRLPAGLDNGKYMRIDLAMIDSADAVFFLPGWTASRGALVEHAYCTYTDKPTFYEIETLKGVL